jgi:hypothetical protein
MKAENAPTQPSRSDSGATLTRSDAAALAGLVVLTAICWCAAYGMWSRDAWSRPPEYLDPEYCDLVGTAAMVKAIAEGAVTPFAWKGIAKLGAPGKGDWNDWPLVEEAQFGLFGLLSSWMGLFAGYNFGLMLGHVAAAVTFYLVARWSSCSTPWAFVASLAYGLAPYMFAQSPHHITCEYIWHIPLFLLVWRWASTEPGLTLLSPHIAAACTIGAIAGLQSPYYTNILCQLTLLGGAVIAWRRGAWAPLVGAGAVVASAAAAFALTNIDTWTYRLSHSGNEAALLREYKWLEIYGFKLVDLFVPVTSHRLGFFRDFGIAHRKAAPLLDEGASYLGIVGIVALLWLVGTAVRNVVQRRPNGVPLVAWQVLWIVLMFNTGGINAILASFFGITLFRTACRYSVVILAIVLLYASRRLTELEREGLSPATSETRRIATITGLLATCLVILFDQVPRAPAHEKATMIRMQIESDGDFVSKMEAALPDGAMVFQLPAMEFPEAPVAGVPSYDHFRPYLYSRDLRFSFGAVRGREVSQWQQAVQQKLLEGAVADQQAQVVRFNIANVNTAVDELQKRGFKAVYINRRGFPDGGRGLVEALAELGFDSPPIASGLGDLVCVLLDKPSLQGK